MDLCEVTVAFIHTNPLIDGWVYLPIETVTDDERSSGCDSDDNFSVINDKGMRQKLVCRLIRLR